ncbi:hypothetical protein EON80_31740 [bacterium]|nr:MAG: hypothetical protein EON80_31740 [bacterium]
MKLLLAIFCLATTQLPLAAEPPPLGPNFNQTISKEIDGRINSLESTRPYAATVLDYLAQGFFVSDENLDKLVGNMTSLERRNAVMLHGREGQYEESRKLIGDLITHLAERPMAQAQLHRRLSYIFEFMGDTKAQASEAAKALQLVTAHHYAVDQMMVTTQLMQADALVKAGQEKEAEPLYIAAFDYPWWFVRDGAYLMSFTEYYARAAKGLIHVRRGNVKALKEIHFTPGMAITLQPLLDKAIRAAEIAETIAAVTAQTEELQKAAAQKEKGGR